MESSLAIIISLFMAVVAIGLFAKKTKVPYPIALMFGGVLLSLIPLFFPRLPQITLDPNLIFLTVLPPILFAAGYFTSIGGFKKNAVIIFLLAVGLVILTTLVVAGVAHLYNGMPWAVAFAFGAIISPPDATAATAITQRLRISHHIVTIIDGESLVNDATALVLLRFSLAAIALGTFSLPHASEEFVIACVGGVLIGLIVGACATALIKRITDASLCITISLISPYLCYLLADELKLSGVLAAVTAGLYMGSRISKKVDALVHIEAVTVWRTVVFLITGAVFILIGLQLPHIIEDLSHYPLSELIIFPIIINAAHVSVRFLWVFLTMYLPTKLSSRIAKAYPYLNWKHALIVSWCGMRGVVSLAAAMSLPLVLNNVIIADRSLIVYLTFTVIFFTLAVQGLTLPFLIRKLKLLDANKELLDEAQLRKKIAETALDRLGSFSAEEDGAQVIQRLHQKYEDTLSWANRIINQSLDPHLEAFSKRVHEAQKDILRAQREEVLKLHSEGFISSQLMRKVLTSIDFESAHLSDRH